MDTWSLGSAGSHAENDSADIRSLKDKLIKLKQNEEYLKAQLEVLQTRVTIMGMSLAWREGWADGGSPRERRLV